MRRSEITVPPESAGVRLDAFLARAEPRHSRARWQAMIDDGQVVVDGAGARASMKVTAGAHIVIDEPDPRPSGNVPQEIPLTVVFEDDDVVVIDKPPGLVVHPAAGVLDGTLVNALLHHVPELDVGGEERPGIVHRLDKETSGLIVCAKHDRALRALQRAFHDRDVEKTYRAWAYGRPTERSFTLITGHMRHPRDRKRFTTRVKAPEAGAEGPVRRAVATYHVVAAADGVVSFTVELGTGRTHQIRAQLADKGFPLVHDELYGGGKVPSFVPEGPVRAAASAMRRHALHAWRLAFPHPETGEQMRFEAALPADVLRIEDALAARGES